MSKKAFITGGTGFLGINLIRELLDAGWEVSALHRPASNLAYLKAFPLHLAEGSIRDYDSLIKAMPDAPDAVFHVAGNTSQWAKQNDAQYQDNVLGTRNMVRAAIEKGAQRFIHTSSVAAFGHHEGLITESTVSNAADSPLNYYRTKYQAELEVLAGLENGLNASILNPCHIIGAYDTHNWAQFIFLVNAGKLPGIPPGRGLFCDVEEVAKAHIAAVAHGGKGERYLLGGVEGGFLDFINEIQRQLGKKQSASFTPGWILKLATQWYMFLSRFHDREPEMTPEKLAIVTEKLKCDDAKARKVLNYRHSSLEKMVADSIGWLREQQLL
jgi:dihydroflavonol-4-reductase